MNNSKIEISDKDKLVTYFNQFQWTHVATLTPETTMGSFLLDKTTLRWIRRLNRNNHQKVHYVYVIEGDDNQSLRNHVHCVLGSTVLPERRIADLWREVGGGENQVLPFDRTYGAGYYIKNWFESDQKGYDVQDLSIVRELEQ